MTQRASSIHGSSSLVLTSVFVLSLLAVGDSSMAQGRGQNDIIRRSRRPVAGRYLVAVRSNDDPDAIAGAAQKQARGRVRHVYRHAFRGFTIETSEATARALAADPGVAYVEEDGVVQTTEQQSLDESDNWGLDRIDQRAVSADGAGYDHTYRHAADGSGVNVTLSILAFAPPTWSLVAAHSPRSMRDPPKMWRGTAMATARTWPAL